MSPMVKEDIGQLLSDDLLASLAADFGEDFAFLATDSAEFAPTGQTIRLHVPVLPDNFSDLSKEDQEVAIQKAEAEATKTFLAYKRLPKYGDKRYRSDDPDDNGRWIWEVLDEGERQEAYVLLRSAHLHRTTHIQGQREDGGEYEQLTGVLRAHLEYGFIDGNQRIPIERVLTDITNSTLPQERRITPERYMEIIGGMGVDYSRPMSVMFQHFGVNPEVIPEILDTMRSYGAVRRMPAPEKNQNGRIKEILVIDNNKPGIPVAGFELGSQDAKFVRNKQSFRDLISTQVHNTRRVITTRREASVRARALEVAISEGKITPDDAKIENLAIRQLRQMSRTYAASHTGGVQIMKVDLTNPAQPKFEPTDQIGVVNAPCGRIDVLLTKDGVTEEVTWDLWKNSGGQDSDASQPNAATAAESIEDVLAEVRQNQDDEVEDVFGS